MGIKIGIENVSGLSNIPKFGLPLGQGSGIFNKWNKISILDGNGQIWRKNADMSNFKEIKKKFLAESIRVIKKE